eukprot:gene23147-biopygen23809
MAPALLSAHQAAQRKRWILWGAAGVLCAEFLAGEALRRAAGDARPTRALRHSNANAVGLLQAAVLAANNQPDTDALIPLLFAPLAAPAAPRVPFFEHSRHFPRGGACGAAFFLFCA